MRKEMLTGFGKWLSSTKFQIAILCIGLIYLQQEMYALNPEVATNALVKIVLGYFGARIVEPIVEFVTKKIEERKNANAQTK